MLGSSPITATLCRPPTPTSGSSSLQLATTTSQVSGTKADLDNLVSAATTADIAQLADLLPPSLALAKEDEDVELWELQSSPTGSLTGGQLHRRARPLKRSSRSKSRDRVADELKEPGAENNGTAVDEHSFPATEVSVALPSGDASGLLQAWSETEANDHPRSSFILNEEGVELGQSTIVDMPKVQSAQEVYTVNIPLEPSDPVQVSKSVTVTMESGETYVVSNGLPEATSVSVKIPPPPDMEIVRPTSPRIPTRSASPLPLASASLQKPLPPLPPTAPVTTTSTIPIPVRTASKLPVTAQWVQPTPISVSDAKISTRPTLFKKRPSTPSESSTMVESPITNGRSSDEFTRSPTPATMDRSLSSDGSTTEGAFSPRASVEAVVDFEGGVLNAPSNLRSGGSVRSLFRKRPGLSLESVGTSGSDHSREPQSPTSPLAPRMGLDLPPGTVFSADANGPSPVANIVPSSSSDSPALSISPSSLSMAEMLAPPTAQQIAEIVGPAMQSFQMRQTDPLAPGTYAVVTNELAVPVIQPQPSISAAQVFVEAGFASRAAGPTAGRVSHYVPREYPNDASPQLRLNSPPPIQPSANASVIIAPRISSLGTARREDVSRKRFTYLAGDNLAAASYLKPILQLPEQADTAFVPLDPREAATCPLCADISERAVRLSCCENVCCSSCIWRWLANRTTCPFCRSRIAPENVAPAPDVQEVIDRLIVKCKVSGCGWEGLRAGLKAHVTNTPEHLVPDRPSIRMMTPLGGKTYVHRRSTEFSHHRRSLSVRHSNAGEARTMPRMQEIFAQNVQQAQLHAAPPLPFTLNRSSGSRRIHIPLRSAHPRIMFRRISGYGSPGGFVKTIHSNTSAPSYIGIPPRVASAALGPARLGLPPLEDAEIEAKVGGPSDAPVMVAETLATADSDERPQSIPDAPTDDVTPASSPLRDTTATSSATRRTRTAASASTSSSRLSSVYSTRRTTYTTRRTSRYAGETTWDLIPDEADIAQNSSTAAGAGAGNARWRDTQRSSIGRNPTARSSGGSTGATCASSGRSRWSMVSTRSKLTATNSDDDDWLDVVDGHVDSDDAAADDADKDGGAAGSASATLTAESNADCANIAGTSVALA
ncbi:hypothetical protein HDU86_002251 [Geranomyces michiganensis]|nr:hypothetical protein HDU86_002251 [Geranomyces michiganensis]